MQSTRQKIVELLKERGRATVEELADAVGLTQMAVRHHLNVLQGENLVATTSVRRKSQPGRPQQLYALTEAANELFPEEYYHLADYLLDEVRASLGKAGLNELLRRIAGRMAAEASPIRPGQRLEEHLERVVQFLSHKGFTARWEAEGGESIFIRILTCPYRQVVREHTEVCHLDMHLIKEMLNVDPVQLTCMANGDEYCTYRISQPVELVMNPKLARSRHETSQLAHLNPQGDTSRP
jgi:predicted ArsR family transcriptional regulator